MTANGRIPLVDLGAEVEALWDELQGAIAGVLRSTAFILGPNVAAFEREAAEYLGVKHAVGLNSGTDALVIALRCLGVGPGDEVITSPFTFYATSEAIDIVGATPVFADIDPTTFNLSPARVRAAIGPRTRALIPVHLFGQAADMDELLALARQHGLRVVEDVAQAMGGAYRGAPLGGLGDAAAFSFFPSKTLGCYGDGGMFVTDDDALVQTARMLRAHGAKQKYVNESTGYNSRLDELQAAILRVKLPRLDAANEGRRQAAARYHSLLGALPGLAIPREAADRRHVYHQYTVRLTTPGRRDRVKQHLAAEGIDTAVYYPSPLHRLPVYARHERSFPEAERAAAEVLSLPLWPTIAPELQQRVADQIRVALELP